MESKMPDSKVITLRGFQLTGQTRESIAKQICKLEMTMILKQSNIKYKDLRLSALQLIQKSFCLWSDIQFGVIVDEKNQIWKKMCRLLSWASFLFNT